MNTRQATCIVSLYFNVFTAGNEYTASREGTKVYVQDSLGIKYNLTHKGYGVWEHTSQGLCAQFEFVK